MKDPKDEMIRASKIKALKELRRMMTDLMLEDKDDAEQVIPKSMQKVTVAAGDEKSLKQGLKKAEEMLNAKNKDLVSDMNPLEQNDMNENDPELCEEDEEDEDLEDME